MYTVHDEISVGKLFKSISVSKDAYRFKMQKCSFKDLDLLCDFEMAGRYDRNDIRSESSESQFKCLH